MTIAIRLVAFAGLAVKLGAAGTDHCVCTGPCPKYGKWVCHYANGTIDEKYKYGDEADCKAACHSGLTTSSTGLVCKFFNETSALTDLTKDICKRAQHAPFNSTWPYKACEKAVKFMWDDEASKEHCPGFPSPWGRFKPIGDALDKVLCWVMSEEKDKESKLAEALCKGKPWLEKEACEGAVKLIWQHKSDQCAKSNARQGDAVMV